MSRNAFPQLEREYNEALNEREERAAERAAHHGINVMQQPPAAPLSVQRQRLERSLQMNATEIMLKVLKNTNELGFIHSFAELEDAIAAGEAELKREPVAWLDTNRWEFVSGARSPVAQFPSGNWVPLYTPTIGETL